MLGSVLYLQSPHRTTVTTSAAGKFEIVSRASRREINVPFTFIMSLMLNRRSSRSRSMYSVTAAPSVPPSLDIQPRLPQRILHPRRRRIKRVYLRTAIPVRAADRGDVDSHRAPFRRGYGAPRLRAAERASLHPCRPPLWRIAASGSRIHRQMSAANEA